MGTPTTTGATTTAFVSCAAQSDGARPGSVFGFASVFRAWRHCRRGKRGTRKAQRYEKGLPDHLVETARMLECGTWRPSRACRFVVRHPKPREILAAEFGDRVVHHLVVPWFERLFEPVFIHDSFANRRGKGSHAGVERLRHFLRAGGPVRRHYLQLDIRNFFNSIHRCILFGQLRARVERDLRRPERDPRHVQREEAERMLWLARVMLTGNPARGALFQGRPADMAFVPPHKQLANAPAETGLPIGNLSSQFFANVYLNELDQFVKHTLKVAAYVRYVDDLVLVHERPEQLIEWRARIEAFLRERLRLELRDPGRLAPVSNGVDFLGYIDWPEYRLVRRRVIGHLRERLETHRRALQCAERLWHLRPEAVAALQASLTSYLGHCRHAQSAGLVRSLFAQHPWLQYILQPVYHGGAMGLRWVDRPAGVTSLASQWRYFRRRYPGHLLLLHVGQRLEMWGAQGDALSLSAGSSPVQRPGLGSGLAWPVSRGAVLRRSLRRRGRAFCQIFEDGYLRSGMKRRSLRWIYTPSESGTAAGTAPASASISPIFNSSRGES
jgi:RNA-directed DNA polymerase